MMTQSTTPTCSYGRLRKRNPADRISSSPLHQSCSNVKSLKSKSYEELLKHKSDDMTLAYNPVRPWPT